MTEDYKRQMCEIGRRMYAREFVAANDGNITCRIGDDQVLCTPTLHCKGFLEPSDIATVNLKGEQLAGEKRRSSEALLHLEIMKARPDVRAVVHCHPPHATAFAVAREPIPQCVLPEVEIFLGEVPIAPYATPGSQRLAESVLPFVHKTNTIVLANHGTVSYGETLERAYWWTEILDEYCRILILAKQLGRVERLTADDCRELLEAKKEWGFTDPRSAPEHEGCDVCGNAVFRDTWEASGVRPGALADRDVEERLIDRVAQRVVEAIAERRGAEPDG